MGTHVDQLEQLFDRLDRGDTTVTEQFFNLIWINFTRFAHDASVQPLFARMDTWVAEHADSLSEFNNYYLLSRGFMAFLKDQYEPAIHLFDKAYAGFEAAQNEDGMAAICIAQGFLYRSMGDIGLSMKNGLRGMEQFSRSGNLKMFQIIGGYWVGGVYAETGHLEEALELFHNALNVDYPDGVNSFRVRLINGIAGVYLKQKKYDLALENFQKALDLCDDTTERTFMARGLTDLGDYYFEMKDYPLAIQYNTEALKLRREMNIQYGAITNLINLGQIYFTQGDTSAAIQILKEALKLADEIQVKVKMYPIHKLLSEIYADLGDFQESLNQYKKYHEIRDAVNEEDMQRRVKNQEKLLKAQQIEKENEIIKAQKIEIENAKKRSDELLHNILPEEVAEELKEKGSAEARSYAEVTVLFTDFKNFTGISEHMSATELVAEIHTCFKAFDEIIDRYNIEKIKTIGDSYMCVAGLPVPTETHAEDMVTAGLEIRDFVEAHCKERLNLGMQPFEVRIGIHTGPVVAGIVGIKKFAYDIWGDTVNTASRMESSGQAGKVNISETTYELVKDKFHSTPRGKIMAKHKGEMEMYFVEDISYQAVQGFE